MTIATIPADKVLGLMDALEDALKVCEALGFTDQWIKLNAARATVIVYLIANLPKLELEVTQ